MDSCGATTRPAPRSRAINAWSLAVLALAGAAACGDVTKAVAFERHLNVIAVASLAGDAAQRVAPQTSGTLGDLHVRVTQDGAAPYDTVVPFPAGTPAAQISIAVPVLSSSSALDLAFELHVNAQPVYTGTVTVAFNGDAPATPASVVLTYVGPVASVIVTPDVSSVLEADTVQLTATPHDVAGYPIPDRSISFTSLDAAIATVSNTGRVVAMEAGQARIVAISESKADTATLDVGPRAAVFSVEPSQVTAGVRTILTISGRSLQGAEGVGVCFVAFVEQDSIVATPDGRQVVVAVTWDPADFGPGRCVNVVTPQGFAVGSVDVLAPPG